MEVKVKLLVYFRVFIPVESLLLSISTEPYNYYALNHILLRTVTDSFLACLLELQVHVEVKVKLLVYFRVFSPAESLVLSNPPMTL